MRINISYPDSQRQRPL